MKGCKMKYILKIFKIFFVLIFILLILLNLILLFSKFVLKKEYPDILGYSYFEVLTGSMRNEINISDIVIVKSQANYQVGDIITYKSKNYVVTHRVVKVEENILVTKGDANNISDEPIYKNQVIGKVVHKIEKAGIYIKVFTDIKVIILMFIIIMLIVFIMSEIEMGNNYSEKNYI
jgi:signal peptidase I